MDFRDAQITPLEPTALVDLATIKEALGVADNSADAKLTALVLACSAAIERYCNALFVERAVVETIRPADAFTALLLTHLPVIALSGLTIDGNAESLDDYTIAKGYGMLVRNDGGQISGRSIVATYTAGYAPAPVVQAVTDYATDLYNLSIRAPGLASQDVDGVAAETYRDAFAGEATGPTGGKVPSRIAAMIGPYVNPFVI